MPRIVVRLSNVYGRETVYPVCHTAKLLAQLAGTKTFTTEALRLIEELGYDVTIEQQTLAIPAGRRVATGTALATR